MRAQIKTLQEQSMTMSVKLKNRKVAEAELGSFVQNLTVPPQVRGCDMLSRVGGSCAVVGIAHSPEHVVGKS